MLTPERTALFLMSNLGVELMRLFSYTNHDDVLNCAKRCRQILVKVVEKEEMIPRIKELEKIADIISYKVCKQKMSINKAQITTYFQSFILRNIATS